MAKRQTGARNTVLPTAHTLESNSLYFIECRTNSVQRQQCRKPTVCSRRSGEVTTTEGSTRMHSKLNLVCFVSHKDILRQKYKEPLVSF